MSAFLGNFTDILQKLFACKAFSAVLRYITQYTSLLFVSRWLERISNHATHIAEELVFWVSGEKTLLNECSRPQ